MERPKIETEHSGPTKVQEPEAEPEPEPNPKDSGQVANGQGNEAGPVKGSESDSQVQTEQSVLRMTPSVTLKKSVRWNPNLVTESTYQASPQASRSYLYYSPSFSVRGKYDSSECLCTFWLCICMIFMRFVEIMGQRGDAAQTSMILFGMWLEDGERG